MVDFGRPGVALVVALLAERRQRLLRPAEKGRLHQGVGRLQLGSLQLEY